MNGCRLASATSKSTTPGHWDLGTADETDQQWMIAAVGWGVNGTLDSWEPLTAHAAAYGETLPPLNGI